MWFKYLFFVNREFQNNKNEQQLELSSENDNNLESKSKEKMKEVESGSSDELKNTTYRGNGGLRKRHFVPRIRK